MPLLYYWRSDNYYRDLDFGAGYHLNQQNPLLHNIDIGDSLWAFTRTSGKYKRYVLAAELVIQAKTVNPPNFRYGKYRVWGDLLKSRYFKVDNQPSVEHIIRSLSCITNAPVLGQSFQGYRAVKEISIDDHLILATFASNLEFEPRAHILPEEKLEASLLAGNTEYLRRLIIEEKPGISEERQQYLYGQSLTRNKKLVLELQDLYEGKCQLCLWDPKGQYQENLCQGHHIHWLSRGGEDDLDNMTLICPNHHAAIHRCDAPLDFEDLAFDFGTFKEPIKLNYHLAL